jgi:hypothetical protein
MVKGVIIMDKIFYVIVMHEKEGIEWPATNFTDDELKVVDRFLKELNERTSDKLIDTIVIL